MFAVQAAITPKQMEVPDFHVDLLQIAGPVEPTRDVTAIEPAISDGLIDDIDEHETLKRPLVE
jgi:hypothetical protein